MFVHKKRQVRLQRDPEPILDQPKVLAEATITRQQDHTIHPREGPTTALLAQDLLHQHAVHVHRVRIVAAVEEDDKTFIYRPILSWSYLTCIFTGFGLLRRIERSFKLW